MMKAVRATSEWWQDQFSHSQPSAEAGNVERWSVLAQ